MRNYQKTNMKFSIFFITVCLMFSVSYLLMDWQWLATANYTLHELLSLPVFIGYLLIPVTAIAGFIIYLQYRKKTGKANPLNATLNALSVLALLLSILTLYYFSGRISTSGVTYDLLKYETNNGYYIRINNIQIKVDEKQYNSLDEDSAYLYVYYHGEWIFGKYSKLDYINAVEELANENSAE